MTKFPTAMLGFLLMNASVILVAMELILHNFSRLGAVTIIVLFLLNFVLVTVRSRKAGIHKRPSDYQDRASPKARSPLWLIGLAMIGSGMFGFGKLALQGLSLPLLTGTISSTLLGGLFLFIAKSRARHQVQKPGNGKGDSLN